MKKAVFPVALRLPALTLALLVIAALVRGCLALRALEDEAPAPPTNPTISLYDAKHDKVIELPLEEYLFGVVASEMPASFPLEALEAQAVSARTYAARRLPAYGGKPCGRHGADLCSDSTCCQAWRAREEHMERWGEDAAFYADKIDQALEETAGVVALYKGKPIDALYFSNSGGRTEDAADVFGGDVPYLVSVVSPGEEDAAHYEDAFSYTRKEFAKALNKAFPEAKLKTDALEEQVGVLSRSEGGRVTKLRLGEVTITGREFRAALGLPSASFTIDVSSGGVVVNTRGFGHGVGMSQYGARAMALDGNDYQQILAHYYTGIALGTLDEIAGG